MEYPAECFPIQQKHQPPAGGECIIAREMPKFDQDISEGISC